MWKRSGKNINAPPYPSQTPTERRSTRRTTRKVMWKRSGKNIKCPTPPHPDPQKCHKVENHTAVCGTGVNLDDIWDDRRWKELRWGEESADEMRWSVWSVKCKCEVWSAKCEVWRVQCEVWSLKCDLGNSASLSHKANTNGLAGARRMQVLLIDKSLKLQPWGNFRPASCGHYSTDAIYCPSLMRYQNSTHLSFLFLCRKI